MSDKRCVVCTFKPAKVVTVRVTISRQTQEWRCVICRHCWQAWETMLDEAEEYRQKQLAVLVNGVGHPGFMW